MSKGNNLTLVEVMRQANAMPDGPRKRALLAQLQPRSCQPLTEPTTKSGLIMPRHVTGEMNKTEAAYARRLDSLKRVLVDWWYFEPLKLRLTDATCGRSLWYTIDFLVCEQGVQYLDEVKGGYITPDGLQKWRMACQAYPKLNFRLMQKKEGGFVCLRRQVNEPQTGNNEHGKE